MFEWFLVVLILVGSLGVIGVLFVILAMILAAGPWQFARVEKGNTVFISKGDDMKAVWPNVGGYRMSDEEDLDGRHWLTRITEPDEKKAKSEAWESFSRDMLWGTKWLQKLLWGKFGIRFVSWAWPQIRVHKFDISRKRLMEGADVESGTPLKSRIVQSKEPSTVRSLLFLVPRPVYLEGVEVAGDNSKLNLLILVVLQQVIPSLPVYYLKGDFFPLLDAAIEAALVDFFATHRVAVDGKGQFLESEFDPKKAKKADDQKGEVGYQESPLTYSHWLKLRKAGGSPIERHLRKLNASLEYYERLESGHKPELLAQLTRLAGGKPEPIEGEELKGRIPHGIIPRFGFALVSIRLVDWSTHTSTDNLAKALLAKETERHLAEGVRQEAAGRGDAFRLRGTGEAERYATLLKAMVEQKVDPDIAAGVLRTQVRTENIRDGKVVTYVEGGADASVMVPAPMGSSVSSTPPAT